MLDAVFNSLAPYCYYLAAGIIACIVALCFDILKGHPPENYKKCIEAVLCGCIAFALCGWVQSHYSSITKSDCLYLAVGIGAIGAGRITEITLKLVLKRFNLNEDHYAKKD